MIKRVLQHLVRASIAPNEPMQLLPHDTAPTHLEPDLFVRKFLTWCYSNDIRGDQEFDVVVYLANEFSEYANVVPLSERQLTYALNRAGIRKSVRDISPDHNAYYRLKCRHIQRPRFTVYDLKPDNVVCDQDNIVDAVDLFPSARRNQEKKPLSAASNGAAPTDTMECQRCQKKNAS